MLTTAGIVGLPGFRHLMIGALRVLSRLDPRYGTVALAVLATRLVQGQFDLFWTSVGASLPFVVIGICLGAQAWSATEPLSPAPTGDHDAEQTTQVPGADEDHPDRTGDRSRQRRRGSRVPPREALEEPGRPPRDSRCATPGAAGCASRGRASGEGSRSWRESSGSRPSAPRWRDGTCDATPTPCRYATTTCSRATSTSTTAWCRRRCARGAATRGAWSATPAPVHRGA